MSIPHYSDGTPFDRETYEWKSASVTVTGVAAGTDLTGITGFTTLFDTIPQAHKITIGSSGTAYIRLNSATNDKITVTATTPYTITGAVVHHLYVSTDDKAVTLTVKLQ